MHPNYLSWEHEKLVEIICDSLNHKCTHENTLIVPVYGYCYECYKLAVVIGYSVVRKFTLEYDG